MMPGLRRILLTALLGAFVGLGVILALFARRPRKPVAARVARPFPVDNPAPARRTGIGVRTAFAVGLVGLPLLAGLGGVFFASRDALLEPGSHATDGPGAAQSTPQPRGLAGPSPPDMPAPTVPSSDGVRVAPNGAAAIAGRATSNADGASLVDGWPAAGAPADREGDATLITPQTPPAGNDEIETRQGDTAGIRSILNHTLIAPDIVARDGTVTFGLDRGVRTEAYRLRRDGVGSATGMARERAEVPFAVPGHDDGVEDAAAKPDMAREAAGADAPERRGSGNDPAEREERRAGPQQPFSTGSLRANPPSASGARASEVQRSEIETALIVRGDSLWKISRRTYGEGGRYTLIHDANQAQIRDPNLIYPGQILVLPSRDHSSRNTRARTGD